MGTPRHTGTSKFYEENPNFVFSSFIYFLIGDVTNTMGDQARSVSTFPLQPCPKRHFSRGVGQPTSLINVQSIFLRHYYIQYLHEMICFFLT